MGREGRRWEEAGKYRGMGITIRKIRIGYLEARKSNFNTGKDCSAAGPALVLKSRLGFQEVEDWKIKVDGEELRRGG